MNSKLAMKRAEQAARTLSQSFLLSGLYDAMSSPMERGAVIAATGDDGDFSAAANVGGFASMAIQSVGHGFRQQDQRIEPVVHLYVTKASVAAIKALPERFEDVEVVVKKVGRVEVKAETASGANRYGNIFMRRNRIACGSSCAPAGETYSGTLGALAKDASGQLFALSNNHIFAACNHVAIGQPIMAPSTSDARPGQPSPREICQHHSIIELRSGTPALVPLSQSDAAIAKVQRDQDVSSWQGSGTDSYDTPSVTDLMAPGMKVKKFGRTTGLTRGVVESLIVTPWALPYKNQYFTATVWFHKTYLVRIDGGEHFALPGDSGSLLVDESGDHALGLVFAVTRNGEYAYVMPIDPVLDHFSLQLVSGHGT